MADPLGALLQMKAIQARQQPKVDLLSNRLARMDEMGHNIALAKRDPNLTVGATSYDMGALQRDMDEDPDTGGLAKFEQQYNSPVQKDIRNSAREDAFAKILMPIEARGKQALDLEHVKGANDLSVAKVVANGKQETSDDRLMAALTKTQQSQQATADRTATNAHNSDIYSRARAAEAKDKNLGWWDRMRGNHPGADEASQLRGQIQSVGGHPQGSNDPTAAKAQEMFSLVPDGNPADLADDLNQQGLDPASIQAIVAAYQQLQSRR